MEILIPLGVLVVWIILQAWVLPRLGREDLNERNLRAEFGSSPCREPEHHQPFPKTKGDRHDRHDHQPQQLAELCKSGKIELHRRADAGGVPGGPRRLTPATCPWTGSTRRR